MHFYIMLGKGGERRDKRVAKPDPVKKNCS